MALIDKLERQQDLTEAERELALYILSHADEVTGMGISELAERSFTSNATIVRLCRKLGSRHPVNGNRFQLVAVQASS